jgi:hypothetical protein
MRTDARWPYRTRGLAPGSLEPRSLTLWGAWVLSTLAVVTTGAAAQQPAAGADEMRSMYCVEVIRAQIDLQRHMISASDDAANSASTPALRQQWIDTTSELLQGLARLEVTRYRLQAYMLPRMQALDSFALATAIRQSAVRRRRPTGQRSAAPRAATPALSRG